MLVYIARHGQDEDNKMGILNGRRDSPLTPLGIEQAHILGYAIKEKNIVFTQSLCSPLLRAHMTASIISDILDIKKPTKFDLLIERDFGVMTGKPTSSIEALCSPDILKTDTITYFLSPEKAETFPELLSRAKKVLDFLEKEYTDDTILLTCHGDVGKMLYCAFYDLPWRNVLSDFHFGNSELLLLSKNSSPEERHVLKQKQFNH